MLPLRTALVGLFVSLCAMAQSSALAVYLGSDPHQPNPPIEVLKRELAGILKPAGIQLDWQNLDARNGSADHADLVVVRLEGVCDSVPAVRSDPRRRPLAYTHVDGNRVLPFIDVRCEVLRGLLGAQLAHETVVQRNMYYGRALARVLAHELYHYLAQSKHHAEEGVGKAAFSARDLLSDDFVFDPTSASRLRRGSTSTVVAAADGEETSGR